MKHYLLTIFGTPESEEAWTKLSPQEMQEHLGRYMAYSQRLKDEGRLTAAEGLSMSGAVLTNSGGNVQVTDGPYVLAKEMIGGFFYYTADSLEEAVAIAKDCPALTYGSKVEVREQMDYGN